MEVSTTISNKETTLRELKEFIDLIYNLSPDSMVEIKEIPKYDYGRYGASEKVESSQFTLTTSIEKGVGNHD